VHVPLSPSSIASRDVISFVKGGMTGIYTSGNGKCPGDFLGVGMSGCLGRRAERRGQTSVTSRRHQLQAAAAAADRLVEYPRRHRINNTTSDDDDDRKCPVGIFN